MKTNVFLSVRNNRVAMDMTIVLPTKLHRFFDVISQRFHKCCRYRR